MNFDLERGPAGDAYKLLVGLVAPRPIALITSMDEHGQLNAAPFSAYNYLCTDPPIIGVGVTNRPGQPFVPKDTARNIRRTGEFVVNVVTEDIAEKMNICATDFPPEMSEVELAGFTTAPSQVGEAATAGRGACSHRVPRVHDDGDWPLTDYPGARCGCLC
jgi:flavin reductase (DIM6/NTAB) family NADH-FMN oxidoreductase RutF